MNNQPRLFNSVLCLLTALRISNGFNIGATNSISYIPGNGSVEVLPEVHGSKFFYFGFGSNMLAQRIHIQNPTAQRMGAALLPDYRLDFAREGPRWRGAVATIVPTPGEHTWGTLWEIDVSNLDDIDNQEGVHLGVYEALTVYVKLRNEESATPARAYMLTKSHQPETNLYHMLPDQVPQGRQPSKTYLQCLIKGAIESSIPEDYVIRLRSIKHNGRVESSLEEKLELQDVVLP
ncbi:gamma-glutamylcyclotransferase [Drosophila subobscura]|uniref:gamma-glutamylcyclotransferase n=1 Tax=Drosophila subobscura TaxID=7241 RepID=UPI00155AC0A1|nr:gamma-glutamylcyclotransferase [Drosophila subobscura]